MKTWLKQEHKLPVDVRGSKTSVLKLSNDRGFHMLRHDATLLGPYVPF